MNTRIKPMVAACALALVASQVGAQDYYLAAKTFTKTLPDGSTVPMWGYVEDIGGVCYNAANMADRLACVNGLPAPMLPGPHLTVDPTDPNLRIYLSNGLSESTSLVIPGQEIPFSATDNGPTWNDNTTGSRGADLTKRVRSFGREAESNGGSQRYLWNNFRNTSFSRPGTFMYHSGTHPQKQVYMGLYGAVTKDAALGEVYPGVTYDNDVVLFYSDIDPAFNTAVAAGSLETSIDYHAKWFLINGEPYQEGMAPISTGTDGSPLATGENILVRFLSAASEKHVPVFQSLYGTIHAEDGIQYTWQDGDTVMATAPRSQYSVGLPPLKTKDVIVNPVTAGEYAVYDGNGYMTNPSDPENFDQGDTIGGMLRFLSVGIAVDLLPTAVADTNIANEGDSTVVVGDLLANDDLGDTPTTVTAADEAGTAITLGVAFATANGGSLILNADGTYSYTAPADGSVPVGGVSEVFNYTITDVDGDISSSTLTITVNDSGDLLPSAVADSNSANEGDLTVVSGDLLANDDLGDIPTTVTAADEGGTTITLGVAFATLNGGSLTLNADGTYSYTAPADGSVPVGGVSEVFNYTITDLDGDISSSTLTIAVNDSGDLLPSAVADTNSANEGDPTVVTGDLLANDDLGDIPTTVTAADEGGTAITLGVAFVTVNGGSLTLNADGTYNYTAPADGSVPVGGVSEVFNYTITDVDGDISSSTLTITVNDTTATAVTLSFSTIGNSTVPGVLSPYDDADIYRYDGVAFSRVVDAISDLGLAFAVDIDGISIVDADTFYVSFETNTSITGLGTVLDEDVVLYDAGVWSLYFEGATCGLNVSDSQDIDAISVTGGTLYFSTIGSGEVGGVIAPYDDADVYTWSGGASCGRILDASSVGLPFIADIDGLTFNGGVYYITFNASTTSVPDGITAQDEDVVSYDGAAWSVYFSGAGLLDVDAGQDLDAIDVP